MPILVGHDTAHTLADVTSNNNHTRMVHGDPFAIYTKAASGYVGFAPGIRCKKLTDVAALGRGIRALQGFQHFFLDFDDCAALSSTLRKEFKEQGAFLAAVGR